MTRVSLDLDPRVITKLRGLANRRNVTIDVIAGELLAAGTRTAASVATRTATMAGPSTGDQKKRFGLIEVDYPEETTSL